MYKLYTQAWGWVVGSVKDDGFITAVLSLYLPPPGIMLLVAPLQDYLPLL